jgi:iron complex outermembrane receptor protein
MLRTFSIAANLHCSARRHVLLAFSTSILFAARLFGGPPATLTGVLEDPSGAAVPGGVVSIYQRSSTSPQTAQSASDGRFRFANLVAGDYLLEASANGLGMDAPLVIHLAAGETQDQTLKLAVVSSTSVITVTAANGPETTDQTSKQLDSVSLDEAASQGIMMLSDALRWVPGLRVSTRGGPGSFTTIETRGLRVTDTAMLLDGFRLRDPTGVQGDASALLGDVFIVDASRAEVLQGSGSSLYGTNSMSGTINVITNPGGGPTHGDIDVDGGGLGLVHSAAHLAGGWLDNRLTYSAGLTYLNETRGVENGTADRNWAGQGYLGYTLTPNMKLSVRVLADSGYLQLQNSPSPAANVTPPADGIIPAIGLSGSQLQLANLGDSSFDQGNATFIPGADLPDARENSSFSSSLFRWQYASSPLVTWHVDYQLVETHSDYLNGPGGIGYQPEFNTSDMYNGRVDTVQAHVDFVPASWEALTVGYEFEREHYLNVSTEPNPDPSQSINDNTADSQRYNAVFLQDQMRLFGDRLQILLSGRSQVVALDAPEFGGGPSPYEGIHLPSPPHALTGDASVAYFFRSTSTKWRAHAGNSFRLPSLYERYGTYFYGGTFTAYGDPRLSPERAVSVDSGFDQYLFHERMRLGATYFYSHLQQVIAFDETGAIVNPATDPYGRFGGYYNTGGGISRGVELSGQFRPSRSTRLFASYTYTNAKDRYSEYYTGTGVDPLAMPRIFPNAVTVTATQQIGHHFDAALTFFGASDYLYPLYSAPYRFPGPRTLDLSGGYTLHPGEKLTTRFYVRVANALNQLYYEDGFLTPRAWAIAGVRLAF